MLRVFWNIVGPVHLHYDCPSSGISRASVRYGYWYPVPLEGICDSNMKHPSASWKKTLKYEENNLYF